MEVEDGEWKHQINLQRNFLPNFCPSKLSKKRLAKVVVVIDPYPYNDKSTT